MGPTNSEFPYYGYFDQMIANTDNAQAVRAIVECLSTIHQQLCVIADLLRQRDAIAIQLDGSQ